jgi:hypothetical protein
MKLYLVHSDEYEKEMVEYGANLMLSYASIPPSKTGEVEIPKGFKDVLLDSGGFQLQTGVKGSRDISLSGYCAWLHYALEKFPEIKGYMTLDILGDINQTLDNLNYMVKEGLTPLPVWHPGESDYILSYYCNEFPYVAIGGIAGKRSASSSELKPIFERILIEHPTTKFHFLGMGLRAGVALRSMRPYSIDFSTWLNTMRFGNKIDWNEEGLLVQKRMSPEESNRVRTDKEFRRSLVVKTLEDLKIYEKRLEELHDPIQMQIKL